MRPGAAGSASGQNSQVCVQSDGDPGNSRCWHARVFRDFNDSADGGASGPSRGTAATSESQNAGRQHAVHESDRTFGTITDNRRRDHRQRVLFGIENQTNVKLTSVNAYTFGPRKEIRVGTLIRTRISSSSGPVYRGKEPQGERGVFRILAIQTAGRRVYVDAVDILNGRTVTLYLAGPNYRSPAPSTVVKPYKFTIQKTHGKTPKSK